MNLDVLIGSCDLYSPLWDNFQITFDRYWNFDTKNVIVSETKILEEITNTKFETILTTHNKWGGRMREGIGKCDSDYIFFILEDYFFDYSYSKEQMETWVFDMEKYDINRLQISGPRGPQTYNIVENNPYEKFSQTSEYLISIQPSIWRKSFLLETLKENYSPWDFEIIGSKLLLNTEHKTFADSTVTNTSKYFNAVRRGFKKSVGWENFRNKENLKDF